MQVDLIFNNYQYYRFEKYLPFLLALHIASRGHVINIITCIKIEKENFSFFKKLLSIKIK